METRVFRVSKLQWYLRTWARYFGRIVTFGRGVAYLEAHYKEYGEVMRFADFAAKVRSGEIPSRIAPGRPVKVSSR